MQSFDQDGEQLTLFDPPARRQAWSDLTAQAQEEVALLLMKLFVEFLEMKRLKEEETEIVNDE